MGIAGPDYMPGSDGPPRRRTCARSSSRSRWSRRRARTTSARAKATTAPATMTNPYATASNSIPRAPAPRPEDAGLSAALAIPRSPPRSNVHAAVTTAAPGPVARDGNHPWRRSRRRGTTAGQKADRARCRRVPRAGSRTPRRSRVRRLARTRTRQHDNSARSVAGDDARPKL